MEQTSRKGMLTSSCGNSGTTRFSEICGTTNNNRTLLRTNQDIVQRVLCRSRRHNRGVSHVSEYSDFMCTWFLSLFIIRITYSNAHLATFPYPSLRNNTARTQVHEGDFVTISKSTTQSVFHDLLCADLSLCMSLEGFACFEAYFKKINEFASSMRISTSSFIVDSVDLEGLEQLWEIVLNATDEDVVADASAFLGRTLRTTLESHSRQEKCLETVSGQDHEKSGEEETARTTHDVASRFSSASLKVRTNQGGGLDEAMSGSTIRAS